MIHFFDKEIPNPDMEVRDTVLAIVLENVEFCSAINNRDTFALELFNNIVRSLAKGIEHILNIVVNLDKIVIMGGFAHATRAVFDKSLKSELKCRLEMTSKTNPDIESLIDWSLGDDADGVIGAALADISFTF